MDLRSGLPDSWTTSVEVVVTLGEPSVPQQDSDGDGNKYMVGDGSSSCWTRVWSGGYGDDRGFVPPPSGFFTGWTSLIVFTVTYDRTPGSCPYRSEGTGGDPGHLIRWTTETRVILKWSRR